jgi:hypothetical protein
MILVEHQKHIAVQGVSLHSELAVNEVRGIKDSCGT